MMNFQFESFLAPVDLPLLAESVRASWGWLEAIQDLRPFALTLAGDVLLIDRANAIYILDTCYGVVERVASSNAALRSRLQDHDFARSILRTDLVLELRSRRIVAKHNQCFAFVLSPRIGGIAQADRMHPIDFRVHLDFLGQMARGLQHMDVGDELQIALRVVPKSKSPRAKQSSLRVQPRDRPSLADLVRDEPAVA
jgi:hypothetical protein